jgi:DNA-binding transcriptional LysR family regulator
MNTNSGFEHLKLRHLVLLKALETHHTLRKAASSLNMYQRAATTLLRELDTTLGAPLFRQDGKTLQLTAEGAAAIRWALEILSDLEAFSDNLYAISRGTEARLRVGISPHAAPILLPTVIAALFRQYPKIIVSIETGFDEQLVPRLYAGEFDCIVVRLQMQEVDRNVQCETLYAETADVVVGAHHPLARVRSFSIKSLDAYNNWIAPAQKGEGYRGLARQLVSEGCSLPRVVLETSSVMFILQMLRVTNWIGLLPTSNARQFATRNDIKSLPLKLANESHPVVLMSRTSDTPRTPAYNLLIRLMRQVTRDMGGKLPQAPR